MASASNTSTSKWSKEDFVRRMRERDNSPAPAITQLTKKEPGSKVLQLGRWIEVTSCS